MGEYSYLPNGLAPTNLLEEQASLDCIFSIAAASISAAAFTANGVQNQPEPQHFMNYIPAIELEEPDNTNTNNNNDNDAANIATIMEEVITAAETAAVAAPALQPLAAETVPPSPPPPVHSPPGNQARPPSPMKNANNPAFILETLRSQIPPSLLATYSSPLAVDPGAAAAAQHRSTLYHAELARQKTIVKAKPDIKSVKELQSEYPDWPVWPRQHGHPHGIKPGDAFSGRGELWLTGAHQQYFRGIDAAGKAPAYAIVLSGEYEDDDDHGDYLQYTGEGGRAEGGVRQAKDQSFESSGNAALKRNFEQGVPVRVMRGAKSPAGEISYTYDGLYCVTSAELVVGRSGKLVCKFAMVGIPGHYKACRKVTFLACRGFKSIQLARRDSNEFGEEGGDGRRVRKLRTKAPKAEKQSAARAAAASAPKRKRSSGKRNIEGLLLTSTSKELGPANKEEYLKQVRGRNGFLLEDISAGVENWPIPVFNESGDGVTFPTDLEYIKKSRVFESKGAEIIAQAALQVMPGQGQWCGIHYAAQHLKHLWSSYNADGMLIATNAFGVWECCDEETCSAAAAGAGGASSSNTNTRIKSSTQCGNNKVVTRGIDLPLEIFRTTGRGWGVRCMHTIFPGQIIATYERELITNSEAELRRDNQSYLFDLDHFLIVRADPTTTAEEHAALPPVPACAITPLAVQDAGLLNSVDGDTINAIINNNNNKNNNKAVNCHDADKLADLMESAESPHLVLDAKTRGNVGRFFNHSCCPNIMVQPVLTQGCSALSYRVAFVAVKQVDPGVELCYNYGQRYFFKEGGQVMPCACGAENCQGVLGE